MKKRPAVVFRALWMLGITIAIMKRANIESIILFFRLTSSRCTSFVHCCRYFPIYRLRSSLFLYEQIIQIYIFNIFDSVLFIVASFCCCPLFNSMRRATFNLRQNNNKKLQSLFWILNEWLNCLLNCFLFFPFVLVKMECVRACMSFLMRLSIF